MRAAGDCRTVKAPARSPIATSVLTPMFKPLSVNCCPEPLFLDCAAEVEAGSVIVNARCPVLHIDVPSAEQTLKVSASAPL